MRSASSGGGARRVERLRDGIEQRRPARRARANSSAISSGVAGALAGVRCRVGDDRRPARAAATIPSMSLFAEIDDHEVQPVPDERLAQRDGERLGARGVVRAVEQDQWDGAPTTSRRPGHAHVGQRLARGVGVERLVRATTRTPRRGGGVPRGVLAEQRQEQLVVGRARAPDPQRLPAHAPGAGPRPPSRGTPAAARRRPPRIAPRSRRAPRRPARGSPRRLPSLMMPGLLARHLGDRGAELGMVERDRRRARRRRPRTRFVASHVPPMPDLEHAERHRLVGEPQVGERGQRLEVRDLILALRVDQLAGRAAGARTPRRTPPA